MEGLTVGRNVHYVAYGTPGGEYPAGAHRAAIVTEVDEMVTSDQVQTVGLCILNPTGMFFNQHVPYSETPVPGTWHWIERA